MNSRFEYRREVLGSRVLGRQVHFGVYRATGAGKTRETFYLLHGGNGDDQQFHQLESIARLPEALQEILAARSAQIVLPYVAGSCLHAHPTVGDRDFSRYFFDELIPAVESGTLTTAATRWIAGLSLGGQAALNAFLRFPNRFAGVGAHFPTLIAFDLWNDVAISQYQARTGVEDGWMSVLKSDLRSEFTSQSEFSAFDPLRLAAAVDPQALLGKPFYFDVGTRDAFGLQEGAQALASLLTQRGIRHEFHLVEGGGHDAPFVHARFEYLMAALLAGSRLSPQEGVRLQHAAGATETRA